MSRRSLLGSWPDSVGRIYRINAATEQWWWGAGGIVLSEINIRAGR
jgi:hypothetical protein